MTADQTAPKLTRLGPYQLVAAIWRGAMGTVHLAMLDGPADTKKLAIVKELAGERERFTREVRLATRFTHANVVHTYGAVEDRGRLYFATEYLDGQPWSRIRRALWQRDALPDALHLKVLMEVLSGLHYIHELRDPDGTPLQSVHGDVSPQNVIVTYDGMVKLVDFGVARAQPNVGRAPEQARGEAVDRRADVFAVGVMLWETLTRRRFVQHQGEAAVQHVRSAVPDAPPALADMCDRALALAPEERFATAEELRTALLGYVGEDMRDSDRARLSELIQRAFQKERASMQAVIEPHLRANAPTNVQDPLAIARKLSSEWLARTQRLRTLEPVPPSPRVYTSWPVQLRRRVSLRELRRGPLPLLVIGVALVSFSVTWLVSRPEPQAVAPAAARAPAEPREPGARDETRLQHRPQIETDTSLSASTDVVERAPPRTVHLAISARPASAVLYLDGVPLSDNPFSVTVGADQQRHTIRAIGIGVAPQERVVTFDRDQVIALDLSPRVARTGSAAPRPARKPQVSSLAPAERTSIPVEAPGGARRRARVSDLFDAPLPVGKPPRPIYEDDPYPKRQ